MSKVRHIFWHKVRRRGWITFLAVLLVLILLRLAMPYVVREYVNRQIDKVEQYSGYVGGIKINLFRGAYKILDLQLVKTNANVPVPFLSIPEMELSVEWRALLRGALVGEVVVKQADVNFVNGPTEAQQQTGLQGGWVETLDRLFPLTINRFQVNDATIRFADPYRDPPVDIYVTNLFATATNLTNVRNVRVKLPAGLVARGKTTGGGRMDLELHMNPMAESPTFEVLAGITNVDLVELNDFMRSYGNFDVQSGKFAVFTDIAAADGNYQGYVKPFFFDAKILTWRETTKQNVFKSFWEAIVQGVSEVFQNQPAEQLATTIPISGTFEGGTDIDVWATLSGVLRNAFVRALLPELERGQVQLPDDEASQNRTVTETSKKESQ